jgi:large subunit ribosomal protein L6
MSRIGRLPVPIPSGVKLEVGEGSVKVTGPRGSLTCPIPEGIRCTVQGGAATLHRRDDSRAQRALHGLSRALLANGVTGVAKGFAKVLEIHGVGYRAEVKGKDRVEFSLGFSHAIVFPLPPGVTVQVEKQTRLTVSGVDRQQVGQVAADIRALRPPEPYKGKGIRYADEVIRKKAGKAAVASSGG